MQITAKMLCHSRQELRDRNKLDGTGTEMPNSGDVLGVQVQLSAVYSEDKSSENYSFSQATPSAQVTMHISNPNAFSAFEQGKEYYLDFRPAE